MIVSYNLNGVGDTLMLVMADSKGQEVTSVRKGDVACVSITETKEVVGWNIFSASHKITNLNGAGQIELSPSQ